MADTSKIDEIKAVEQQLKQVAKPAAEPKATEANAPATGQAPAGDAKGSAAAKAEQAAAKEEEKPRKVVLERLVSVPLVDAYKSSRSHRARRASAILREFAARHLKAAPSQVKISNALAAKINAGGSRHPPKKLKALMRKLEDGTVQVEPETMPAKPAAAKAKPKSTPPKAAAKQESKPAAAPTK